MKSCAPQSRITSRVLEPRAAAAALQRLAVGAEAAPRDGGVNSSAGDGAAIGGDCRLVAFVGRGSLRDAPGATARDVVQPFPAVTTGRERGLEGQGVWVIFKSCHAPPNSPIRYTR
jgi:hypothetical protein